MSNLINVLSKLASYFGGNYRFFSAKTLFALQMNLELNIKELSNNIWKNFDKILTDI